jgi:DNA-binding transcriptional ArsR family regulator
MYVVSSKPEPVPDVWQALADPTRRELIDRLADGAKTTSQLCAGLPMSRFGVMKHLGILERAGLVIARRQGRLRFNHLNAAPLHALQARWLSPRAASLASAIAGFGATMEGKNMNDADPDRNAGVVDVALEWPVAASVQRVWDAWFNHPERWWPPEHRALGMDSVFAFEARLGAELREEKAGQGLAWYRVMALDPQRSVDLVGHLAARYGGPATSLLHIELVPAEADGSCLLKLTDSVFGRIGPELRASLTSGWQAIVGDGLVAHVEKGEGA